MYKIYVIKQWPGGSERQSGSETTTSYPGIAKAAFWAAYNDERFNGAEYLLLLTENHKKIAVYRFASKPGERDYIAPDEEIEL